MHAPRRHLFTTRIPIRWGDMDAYGHVNNTIYFRYMEQARIEALENLGFLCDPSKDTPVIVNAACTFQLPMVYPGTVELRMYTDHVGRSSFMTWYELGLAGDDKIYAEGSAKVVWMNPATGKSVPLPDWLRAVLEGEGGKGEM